TIRVENASAGAFETSSPISLTGTGEQLLRDSGLKSFVDGNREHLTTLLAVSAPLDLYAIQERAYRLLESIHFEESFARNLNRFAFRTGTSIGLLRHLAAIYLRDIATKP